MTDYKLSFEKIGFVFKPNGEREWWQSRCMAPVPIMLNKETIRVYMGCWDRHEISRIGYIDVSSQDPTKVLGVAEKPVLDIGRPGMFDDNGVFPAHAYIHQGEILFYYTGFQLSDKVRYLNYGGLATTSVSNPDHMIRVSEVPILDRSDEGLYVRAGQSVIHEDGVFKSVYSAGSKWIELEGKLRPCYDICYTESTSYQEFPRTGKLILTNDESVEHGLGRPQLVKLKGRYYVFYTRRRLGMDYYFGVAGSTDCQHWERLDHLVDVPFGI